MNKDLNINMNMDLCISLKLIFLFCWVKIENLKGGNRYRKQLL